MQLFFIKWNRNIFLCSKQDNNNNKKLKTPYYYEPLIFWFNFLDKCSVIVLLNQQMFNSFYILRIEKYEQSHFSHEVYLYEKM